MYREVDVTDLKRALALINSQEQRIKELAEDLHATRTELTRVQEENERLMRYKTALECVVSTARNQAKADTVRKLQERLKAECNKYLLNSGITLMLHQHID
jgi:hypothetical protein